MPNSTERRARKQGEAGWHAATGECMSGLAPKDRERGGKLAALQEAITLGLESPNAGELDIEAIKKRARVLADS